MGAKIYMKGTINSMIDKRNKSFLKVLATSFIYTLIAFAPWLLLCKFIIKLNMLHYIYFILLLFMVMWMAAFIGLVMHEKPEKQRERILEKWALVYGKFVVLYITIQFVIVVILLVLTLINKEF